MDKLRFTVTIAATIGSLLFSTPSGAQVFPLPKKAAHVEIIEGPALELAHDDLIIISGDLLLPGDVDRERWWD